MKASLSKKKQRKLLGLKINLVDEIEEITTLNQLNALPVGSLIYGHIEEFHGIYWLRKSAVPKEIQHVAGVTEWLTFDPALPTDGDDFTPSLPVLLVCEGSECDLYEAVDDVEEDDV